MKTITTVLLLLSVPPVVALGEAVSFFSRNATNESIQSSGIKRDYLLYVPRSYDRRKPTPLVISMHAAGLWAAAQMQTSQWNRIADREGFIVVYPEGTDLGGPRIFHVERSAGLMLDVLYISDMIDTLRAHYHIDPAMIYANGLSNGGGMSFVLSCTLGDKIAAVGLVASAQTLPFEWCPDTRPVPMIAIHGTADPVTPYHGGTSWVSRRGFPDIPGWVEKWARRNQCAPQAVDRDVARDITRRSYYRCAYNADVVLYSVRGGGHTWPGGEPLPEWMVGKTSNSIDASQEMWQFFKQHRLRP
jgi:polyhydroxybutyrate depolymerase